MPWIAGTATCTVSRTFSSTCTLAEGVSTYLCIVASIVESRSISHAEDTTDLGERFGLLLTFKSAEDVPSVDAEDAGLRCVLRNFVAQLIKCDAECLQVSEPDIASKTCAEGHRRTTVLYIAPRIVKDEEQRSPVD